MLWLNVIHKRGSQPTNFLVLAGNLLTSTSFPETRGYKDSPMNINYSYLACNLITLSLKYVLICLTNWAISSGIKNLTICNLKVEYLILCYIYCSLQLISLLWWCWEKQQRVCKTIDGIFQPWLVCMPLDLNILSWALTFIIRLRFPPEKSIATIITSFPVRRKEVTTMIFLQVT